MIRVNHFILDIIALVWAMTLLLPVLRISGDYSPSVRKQEMSGKNIHVREYHFRRYKKIQQEIMKKLARHLPVKWYSAGGWAVQMNSGVVGAIGHTLLVRARLAEK